jgi:hypothetical protein
MKPRAVAYITYGQAGLLFFLLVCVALHPGFVLKADEGGMSNYGVHIKTAGAYTLALGLPLLLSVLALRLTHSDDLHVQRFRQILVAYCWLLVLTLVSTYVYSLNTVLKDLHIVFGSALTAFQTATSVWMYRILRHAAWDRVLFAIQIFGFLLATLTIIGVLHVLFVAEVVSFGAFALLLVHTAKRLCVTAPDARRVR